MASEETVGEGIVTAEEYGKAARPTTDTNLLIELLVGVLGTAVTFFVVVPFEDLGPSGQYVYDLVRNRGPIQYAELFMFWMVIAHIFMKLRIIKSQLGVLAVGPVEHGLDLGHDETVFDLRKKVRKMPEFSWSILLNRIDRAFSLWLGTKDVERVGTWAMAESEREAISSDASFMRTSLLVASIPILGFIGTVLGLGSAISGFSKFLEQGSSLEMSQITASLQEVTGGLGTAFDTTLLALVLSILAQFPLASVQRREENLIVEVENYVDDNIVCRFPPQDQLPMEMEAIEDAIDAAFRRYIPDPDRYDEVFTRAIERAGGVVEERFTSLANNYEAALQDLTLRLSTSLSSVGETMEVAIRNMVTDFKQQDDSMVQTRRTIGEEEGERIRAMMSSVASEYSRSAEALQSTTREAAESSLGAAKNLAGQMQEVSRMSAQIQDLLHIEQSLEKSLAGIANADEFRKTLSDLRQHLATTEAFVTRMKKPKVITLREEVLS